MTTPLKKIIHLATNYNSKLAGTEFIHIDLPPRQHIPRSVMRQYEIEIRTKDGSHPPIACRMHDICLFPFAWLNETTTMASHGMSLDEYTDFMLLQCPHLSAETLIAAYFYCDAHTFFSKYLLAV